MDITNIKKPTTDKTPLLVTLNHAVSVKPTPTSKEFSITTISVGKVVNDEIAKKVTALTYGPAGAIVLFEGDTYNPTLVLTDEVISNRIKEIYN